MTASYDAIVVGSGATGGWAAKELTESGLSVALLDAGPALPFGGEPPTSTVTDPWRQPIQSGCYAFDERTSHLFVDDVDNPYSHPDGAPYDWIRSRQVGGRLHLWGRTSVRMSDRELKATSHDGIGEDWPISHRDLAPYYERVERFLAVCGMPEGLQQMPDGAFVAPSPLTRGEISFKSRIERRWATRRVTGARIAQAPPDAMIVAAQSSGRLDLRADSIVSRVLLDRGSGRARGVAFIDRLSKREEELNARLIVLCASTIESTRILLNSATEEHPAGLGNSSGALGHYLMDHTSNVGIDGRAPWPLWGEGAPTSFGCMIPAFRNVLEPDVDFVRSYEIESQIEVPPGGWARQLARLRRPRSGRCWMRAFGEVLPVFENQVSLDPSRTDAWGIPTVRVECRYGDNERRMAEDQAHCIAEIAAACGWEVEAFQPEPAPPGHSVHEVGTARMGASAETSVLNAHNQCWDVPNLFVTDGACFTSSGHQNPTLTMMAITARACAFIVERLKRREL